MSEGTALDPQGAIGGANQLTGVGDTMLTKWVQLRARIEELQAQQPWGNDEVGKTFHDGQAGGGGYLGGANPAATNTLDVGESLVRAIALLGPQVLEGVQGTADLDELIAEWFPKK
jgi:hypothetical protein